MKPGWKYEIHFHTDLSLGSQTQNMNYICIEFNCEMKLVTKKGRGARKRVEFEICGKNDIFLGGGVQNKCHFSIC